MDTSFSSSTPATMPSKKYEMRNAHMDSRIWNTFPFRSDDIIIATPAKAGTTWAGQIVAQLISGGDPDFSAAEKSFWLDFRIMPREHMLASLEAQEHRRFIKTHLPVDAVVWKPELKYVYVARDLRDVMWSMHHHYSIATDDFWSKLNDPEGLVGEPVPRPPEDPRDLFVDLVEDDTRPSLPWPFWRQVKGWFSEARGGACPNLLLVHFSDLKRDLDGEMRRIHEFLGTPAMTAEQWARAVHHCTFEYMKGNAKVMAPGIAETAFEGGAKNFINKGTNGRWRDRLSDEDIQRYEEKARSELGEECARWLEKGRLG